MNKKILSAIAIIFTAAFFAFSFSHVKAQSGQAGGQTLKNQEQNREQNAENKQGIAKNEEKNRERNAQQHRSEAAEFVLNLLKVAERSPGGIGEQVRAIAREQNEATEKIAGSLDKIEKRSKIKTFFAGSDYKNLGQLRSEMVHVRNRIERLSRLMERIESEQDRNKIQSQIQAMEQERTRIENFIKTNEDKFSLFGWFVKLFNKNK